MFLKKGEGFVFMTDNHNQETTWHLTLSTWMLALGSWRLILSTLTLNFEL